MRRWLLISLGVALILAGAGAAYLGHRVRVWEQTPMPGAGRQVAVEVGAADSLAQVAERLAERKVIDDAQSFARWVEQVEGAADDLRPGELAFTDAMSPVQVLAVLREGRRVEHEIVLIPGLRIDQVADRLAQAGLVDPDAFVRRAQDESLASALGVPASSMEGYLAPGRYALERHMPIDEVIKTLVAARRKGFSPEWRARARMFRMSDHQVLTLASLVEAEARVDDQRERIAAVLANRLRFDWKLDSDASAAYAAWLATGTRPDPLGPADLARDQVYNTHVRRGLPPGPICSPGDDSIKAALWPARTDDMYFVPAKDGGHHFCPDLICAQAQQGR